jgi:hypothetical protein
MPRESSYAIDAGACPRVDGVGPALVCESRCDGVEWRGYA